MKRIVIAVDPPASHGKKANACGIICAGLGDDGLAYVLDDSTIRWSARSPSSGRSAWWRSTMRGPLAALWRR
jgi:phage terminase large subunit-like protein